MNDDYNDDDNDELEVVNKQNEIKIEQQNQSEIKPDDPDYDDFKNMRIEMDFEEGNKSLRANRN
jgi:hypothetical protein